MRAGLLTRGAPEHMGWLTRDAANFLSCHQVDYLEGTLEALYAEVDIQRRFSAFPQRPGWGLT